MTSRWRKILLGVVICLALVLVALWLQHRASLQDDSLGQIAYESSDDQESAIYLMNPDGSHRSQVTQVKASLSVCCPAWSSDGKQLAYAVQKHDQTSPTSLVESIGIFDLAVYSHTAVKCSTHSGYSCSGRGVLHLRWSREDNCFHWITKDSTMYFERTIPSTNVTDAQDEYQCEPFAPFLHQYEIGFSRELTYSPEGHYYLEAVYQRRSNKFESFLVSTDGVSTSLGLEFITAFAWSPDTQQLVFTKANPSEDTNQALYLVHIADPVLQPLVTHLDVKRDPTWSPDSRWIAFSAAGPDGNVDIYKVNIETKEVTRLTTELADDRNPVWRPTP